MNQLTIIKDNDVQVQVKDNLNSMVSQFILAQDIKANSKYTYQKSLEQFMTWIVENNIQRPDRNNILAYKEYLQAKGLSALTLSNYIVAVRRFFEWAEGMRYYPNVAKGVKGGKQSRSFKKDCLTVAQIKELLNSINKISLEGKRNFAMLNLLIRTALRTVEVVRANVEDIRQQGGEAVLWVQGKGRDNKDEFVLLTDSTLKPINEYLNARGRLKDNAPLFASGSRRNNGDRLTTRSIRGIVKAGLRNIGINNSRLTAHSLRHSAITLSLQGGATVQEAQILGRHANINTTMGYAQNINRIAQAPERKIDYILAG